MAQCVINGVAVHFPYEPYKVQEEYMKKVIDCLNNGFNGILESPTGTGKTLSLLCSSLAWLETRKAQQQLSLLKNSAKDDCSLLKDFKSLEDINQCWDVNTNFMLPKVIYSSRTHSQLSQATQELKRSSYRYMKSVVLGSRDQLCLHSEVQKAPTNTAKLYMCHAKTSSKSCPFYTNYEEKILSISDYQDKSVFDIEDLVTLGKKHRVCPYYAARNLQKRADMVFTPYNYIIDPKSRRAFGTELQGNVLIFDEAHNMESACEESMSFQLRSLDLALCISEITQVMQMVQEFENKDISSSDNNTPDFTLTDLSILKVMFCELEEILDKAVAECSGKDEAKSGDFIYEVLSKVELTPGKREVVLEILDKIISYLFTTSGNSVYGAKGAGLQRFSDLLNVLYSKVSDAYTEEALKKEFATKYKVFLQYDTINKSQNSSDPWSTTSKKNKSWKLDFWCFSPSLRFQELMEKGVHSIILTSGTLSPLGPMITELGVPFPVQLENPHIIKNDQIFVGVITSGPDGNQLNSSYQNRFNEAYISSLGRTICNFGRVVPDGLLVFFPSYSVMKSNQESWEENGVWRTLSGIKPLFVEPQGKDAFQESMEKYYAAVQDPSSKGATLLAVCRGKVSEGLDFADQNARGVIITGLPFPPSMDPRVKLKMAYLNSISNKELNGNDWYVLQASRAVNQAIGRVIRHKNDFGAILLCDNRFQQKRIQQLLSKWIHGRITVFDSFGPALKQLSCFFKAIDHESLKPKQAANQIGSFQVTGVVSSSVANIKAASSQTANANISSQNSVESIFEGYKLPTEDSTAEIKNNISTSVFDAYENYNSSSKQNIHLTKTSSCSSTDVSKEETPLRIENPKPPKRPKLRVILRQANPPESKESVAEKWKKFLIEIKTLLNNSGKYSNFCSAVKQYKANKDATHFGLALKSIFMEIPNKQHYFQTASQLCESKDREKFLLACLT